MAKKSCTNVINLSNKSNVNFSISLNFREKLPKKSLVDKKNLNFENRKQIWKINP